MSTHACRACGQGPLREVLDLGTMPLANALLPAEKRDAVEATYPLVLVFCAKCAALQITETVDPAELFSDYPYFSSFSDTMLRHAETLATRLRGERHLDARALVVEVASNDGYLLQYYRGAGVPVLGIEPANNIARYAEEERGIPTLCRFFSRDLAAELAAQGKRADVIHAHNVLAHVPDPGAIVAGFRALLKDDGVAVVEVPYARDMIDHLEFDTIYHEHMSYFSLTALHRLCSRHGMAVVDVETHPIHGGSLRVFAAPEGGPNAVSNRVGTLLDEELQLGMNELQYYRAFSSRVDRRKQELRTLLADLRSAGHSIAAYGASAKGATLLNCFEIGPSQIDFVVDRSTHKQGFYTPGTRLPILAPEVLLERQPDYVLLLTWNFRDEILDQQAAYRRAGGKFIVPIPALEIV